MGRKRKKDAAAVERPIFCFYCDRVFADETTLITHQKGTISTLQSLMHACMVGRLMRELGLYVVGHQESCERNTMTCVLHREALQVH